MIQFTAAISSGSSGGALLNNNGEIIGMTSASYIGGQNLTVIDKFGVCWWISI